MTEVLRGKNRDRAYPLPEKGIYDENGILFHHGYPRTILDVHRERLAQHGIELRGKPRYSKEEVETLQRNWEAYRKEYGFSYWSILKLCGKGSTPSERHSKNGELEQIRNFLQETNFWPRFCAGLQRRASTQIKAKIYNVFDFYRDFHVTVEERSFCEKLYMSSRSLVVVAEQMQRSIKSVQGCILYLRRRKMFSFSERRWLWTSIKNIYPDHFTGSGVPKADTIDWKTVENKMLRNSAVLEQQWNEINKELESKINAGLTLEEALDIVAPKCQRVSPLQIAHFIEIVRSRVIDDESQRIAHAENIIAPLMMEQNLTGFDSKRHTEFDYLRIMVNGILCKIRKRILRPCGLILPLKALLKVLVEVLRTLLDSDKPQKIRITTKHFLQIVIKLRRADDRTWMPRNKKLRKVITELFPDLI